MNDFTPQSVEHARQAFKAALREVIAQDLFTPEIAAFNRFLDNAERAAAKLAGSETTAEPVTSPATAC